MLKKNTEEKSNSSASFFWTNAVASPLSTNTWSKFVKTITSANIPNTSGAKSLAKTIETTSDTVCAPDLSANLQIKLLTMTFDFISI